MAGPSRFRWYRLVDVTVALLGGAMMLPVVAVAGIGAAISTRSTGVFRQLRVGRGGVLFTMIKLQTMRSNDDLSTVTTDDDARITGFGRTIRRMKLDELPQLVNVARGEMALLGPRPDVPGFADLLCGRDRCVVEVRPGITGPATLLMRNEGRLLARMADPEHTNRELLYPLKTAINRAWIEKGTPFDDAKLLVWTVFSPSNATLYRAYDRWDPNLRNSEAFRLFEEIKFLS